MAKQKKKKKKQPKKSTKNSSLNKPKDLQKISPKKPVEANPEKKQGDQPPDQGEHSLLAYSLTPLDTLFFRDGKPFTKGEDSWADETFPPSPATVFGALRTAYFSGSMDDFEKAGEKEDPTQNLAIKSFHLSFDPEGKGNGQLSWITEKTALFPLPLDLVGVKGTSNGELFSLKMERAKNCSSNPFAFLLTAPKDRETWEGKKGYLCEWAFSAYLSGEEKIESFLDLEKDSVLKREAKIGIGRSFYTRTSEDGLLYRVGMIRLNSGFHFHVEFEGLDLTGLSLLRLGGEAKAVRAQRTNQTVVPFPTGLGEKNRYFKIFLSTPTIFEQGWHPRWIHHETLEGERGNARIKLLSACIGKSLSMGGFDMKHNIPKRMYRAVPPGSVYYFELIEGSFQDVEKEFHGRSISDQRAEEGFGIGYVGAVSNTK